MENGGGDLSSSKPRAILSHYREIENRIKEGKDEIADASSKKFTAIMNEVENIHQHVNKPREQVADAEALLGLTNVLMASVKSHNTAAVSPAEFVSSLIREFGRRRKRKGSSDYLRYVKWGVLGSRVSPIFMKGSGCRTMIGPMEKELKRRKSAVRAKRATPGRFHLPEEVRNRVDLVSDTDRNIHVMFEVLKREKRVKLESLILNRYSFAHTIENIFALSFLVKEGRVHISVDEIGSQFIAPRNAPTAKEIKAGTVQTHQFMFRFDFNDWKVMKRSVREGEEVMPQRYKVDVVSWSAKATGGGGFGIPEAIPIVSRPVERLSRNYNMAMPLTITV